MSLTGDSELEALPVSPVVVVSHLHKLTPHRATTTTCDLIMIFVCPSCLSLTLELCVSSSQHERNACLPTANSESSRLTILLLRTRTPPPTHTHPPRYWTAEEKYLRKDLWAGKPGDCKTFLEKAYNLHDVQPVSDS